MPPAAAASGRALIDAMTFIRANSWDPMLKSLGLLPQQVHAMPSTFDSAAKIGLAETRIVGEEISGPRQGNYAGLQYEGAAGDFQGHC
jgi:hypothetical protein